MAIILSPEKWQNYGIGTIQNGFPPKLNLSHEKCDSAEKLQGSLEAAAKRDERTRDRELKSIAAEIESKKQKLNEPGEKVMDISLNLDLAMEVETQRSSETETAAQTEEFDYLFRIAVVKPPFDETSFANDDD